MLPADSPPSTQSAGTCTMYVIITVVSTAIAFVALVRAPGLSVHLDRPGTEIGAGHGLTPSSASASVAKGPGIPQFAPSKWEAYCSEKYGPLLVENWAAAGKAYCGAADAVSDPQRASMVCYRFRQHERQLKHMNNDARADFENQCIAHQLRVDYDKVRATGKSWTSGHPVYGRGWDGPAKAGTFTLGCTATSEFATDKFRLTQQKMMKGLQTGVPKGQCDVTVDHPVLFLTRFEYQNLYHSSTDWMNVVLASAVMGSDRALHPATICSSLARSVPLAHSWPCRAQVLAR